MAKKLHIAQEILDIIYPVGSIYLSVNSTTPSSLFGGTWTLINKVFKSRTSSNEEIFTKNDTNVDSVRSYLNINGQAIEVFLNITTRVKLSDTTVNLGTVNFDFIGISGINHSLAQIPAGSDTGDGIALLTLNYQTGELTCVDVIGKNGSDIPAGSSFTVAFHLVVPQSRMLNEACEQFVWERIS